MLVWPHIISLAAACKADYVSLKAAARSCEHPKFVVWPAAVNSVYLAFQFGRSELKSCSCFSMPGSKYPICLRGNLTVIQYSQEDQQHYENVKVISLHACFCRPKANLVLHHAKYVHIVIKDVTYPCQLITVDGQGREQRNRGTKAYLWSCCTAVAKVRSFCAILKVIKYNLVEHRDGALHLVLLWSICMWKINLASGTGQFRHIRLCWTVESPCVTAVKPWNRAQAPDTEQTQSKLNAVLKLKSLPVSSALAFSFATSWWVTGCVCK